MYVCVSLFTFWPIETEWGVACRVTEKIPHSLPSHAWLGMMVPASWSCRLRCFSFSFFFFCIFVSLEDCKMIRLLYIVLLGRHNMDYTLFWKNSPNHDQQWQRWKLSTQANEETLPSFFSSSYYFFILFSPIYLKMVLIFKVFIFFIF